MRRVLTLAGVLGIALASVGSVVAAPEEAAGSDAIPTPFLPFEHLIGGWKGTSVPKANPLKGWAEKHTWAWKFDKGQPVGMTVKMEGNKQLAQGTFTYDSDAETYRMEGTDPTGKAIALAGAIDANGKFLAMDRVGDGKERLTIRLLPDNKIRYIVFEERKEAGSPKFARVVETGLTKEGESLGGTAASEGPKCIVTGGSATMSVTFEGKSFPLCCTGCRDEFNDNPAKYVKKALLRSQNAGKTSKVSDTGPLSKDDGSFEGLTDDKPKKAATPAPKPKLKPKARPDSPADKPAAAPSDGADAETPATAKDKDKDKVKDKPSAEAAAKAVGLLKQAQALDKQGKAEAALGYYRRLVADYADTPQAKAAAARIQALAK